MTFTANANSVYVDGRDGGWRDEVAGHGRVLAARGAARRIRRHDQDSKPYKFAVPEAEQAEFKAIIASTRADIVV
jgi:hypothetical protein